MLAKWTELLPLFVVKYLAKKYCERTLYYYEGKVLRVVAVARPDVLIKINPERNYDNY